MEQPTQAKSASSVVDMAPKEPLKGHPKYQTLADLGTGSFGFVQKCLNKQTGDVVAIKFLKRGPTITKHVVREVVCHSGFFHIHVAQFHEVFLTDEYLAIVMEYAPGGDLLRYVRAKRGLQALDYCHRLGVVNRDIKLENALLDATQPRPLLKLTDFGLCKDENQSLCITRVGTPHYTAPEVILGGNAPYAGTKADIWSCGVMLYTLLFSQYPFERPGDRLGDATNTVLQRIVRLEYSVPAYPLVSAEAKDLLQHMLVANVDQRYTIADIVRHPWFRKGLPEKALAINDECVRARPHANDYPWCQPLAEVTAIAHAAMRRPTAQMLNGARLSESRTA